MILALTLPSFGQTPTGATVRALHVAEGAWVGAGTALLDIGVDFSRGVSYDCPPIAHYRLVSRDEGWLRRLDVRVGDAVDPRAVMGLLSSGAEDALTDAPDRAARLTLASIVGGGDWWDGSD